MKMLLRAGMVLLVANEIRGLILAAPIMWVLYQTGGTAMAVWIAICSLAGIALSVVVPTYLARKLLPKWARQNASEAGQAKPSAYAG